MIVKLMEGIREFKKNIFPEKKSLFSALKKGQTPEFLFITCADSRIIPSLLTHSELGDLFVVRNVGNIIPPYYTPPSGEAAAIEYALNVLKVKQIIVCGHSHCGAMQGLLTPALEATLPAVAGWLAHTHRTLTVLRDKYPQLIENSPHKLMCATKESTLVQIENLKTHPSVQRKLAEGELTIHAWLYEFELGEVLIYSQDRGDFIPFEDAVTEVFCSDYILKKMSAIVEDEAMQYLATQASPKTLTSYHELMHVFQELKIKGIGIIWENIQGKTTSRLWSEFGRLCETDEEGVDPRFRGLIQRCLDVKLTHLKCFQKDIVESQGYALFCSQMIRKLLSPPPLPSSSERLSISREYIGPLVP